MWPKNEISALVFAVCFWNLLAGLAGGGILGILIIGFFWGVALFDWLILAVCLISLAVPAVINHLFVGMFIFATVSLAISAAALSLAASWHESLNEMIQRPPFFAILPFILVVIYYGQRTYCRYKELENSN
jgi:hypothetical protein